MDTDIWAIWACVMCACLWQRCKINKTSKDGKQRQWEYLKKKLASHCARKWDWVPTGRGIALEKGKLWRSKSLFLWGSEGVRFFFFRRIYCMPFSNTAAETHTSRAFTSSRVHVNVQIWFITYRFSGVTTVDQWHQPAGWGCTVQNVRICQSKTSSRF